MAGIKMTRIPNEADALCRLRHQRRGGLADGYSTMIAAAAHASNLTHPQPLGAALLRFQRFVMVAA